jgi:hypothetical protein
MDGLDLAQVAHGLPSTDRTSRARSQDLRQRNSRRWGAANNGGTMARKLPLDPPHPERTCWGCDRYCATDGMVRGNGTERTQRPGAVAGAAQP